MAGTWRKRRWCGSASVLAAALLAIPALGGSAAVAQLEDEGPILDVKRVVVPKTRAALVSRGVRVRAACSAECVLVVKVRVPRGMARKMLLRGRLIGSGAAGAKANRARWVTARINRRAGQRLLAYRGGGRIQVRIRALP